MFLIGQSQTIKDNDFHLINYIVCGYQWSVIFTSGKELQLYIYIDSLTGYFIVFSLFY